MNWYKQIKIANPLNPQAPAVQPPQHLPSPARKAPQSPTEPWDPFCPNCGKQHGFPPDTADADCPHCKAWLTTRRTGGPLELAQPEREEPEDLEGKYWDRRIDEHRDDKMMGI